MKVRIYTNEEIAKLKQCTFVRNIKYKREIVYDPLFKLWCIMMRLDFPELSAQEIFSRGGLDVNILHPNLPRRRIKTWLENYKKFGLKYFLPETEPYQAKTITKDEIAIKDSFREQLSKYVIRELKELENAKLL